jgi:hypothetical protein
MAGENLKIPMASTRYQQSLFKVSGLHFEKWTSIWSFCQVFRRMLTNLAFLLNILLSMWNITVYLHFRVPEDQIETLFDLFGWSLVVAFWTSLYASWTSGLLKSMASTKQTFWEIKKDFIDPNNHSCCSWDPWDCKQRKIFKGMWFILLLFVIFVKPVLVEKYVHVGHRPQTIAWYAFAVKPFWILTTQLH